MHLNLGTMTNAKAVHAMKKLITDSSVYQPE